MITKGSVKDGSFYDQKIIIIGLLKNFCLKNWFDPNNFFKISILNLISQCKYYQYVDQYIYHDIKLEKLFSLLHKTVLYENIFI